MADKMISDRELQDEFLTVLIRADEPLKAPEGFMEGVMNQISLQPVASKIKPYSPPVWLKWGIPVLLVSSLVSLIIWGSGDAAQSDAGLSAFEKLFKEINSWFSGASINIAFPSIPVSSTVIWVLAGCAGLTWMFILLSKILENRPFGRDR